MLTKEGKLTQHTKHVQWRYQEYWRTKRDQNVVEVFIADRGTKPFVPNTAVLARNIIIPQCIIHYTQ